MKYFIIQLNEGGEFVKLRKEYTCPLEIVHDIIKGKWKTIILFQLRDGAKSLSELEREIHGISQKMLLEQLKELQVFGLVDKKTFPGYPLHVEYFLTDNRGLEMLKALNIMQQIGIDYLIESGKEDLMREKGIIKD